MSATVFYVDNQNAGASDTNPGSVSQPWKTIQKAASTAVAGDTVIVQPGVYNEFVTIANSGSAGNPITFEGVRSNGDWLTILDPSTPMTNGWVPAPEVGAGVWKNTNGTFETHEMTLDGKRLAFVWTNGNMQVSIDDAYTGSGLTNGFDILALPSNATVTVPSGRATVQFWDGVEAMYCAWYDTNYIRFRDGRDPNGLNIRVAPNRDGSETSDLDKPALKIIGNSYVTWRNFKMLGAIGCIDLEGTTAHDDVIDGNYLAGGVIRVLLAGGAYNNVISSNFMTTDYYGFTNMGAWGGGSAQSLYAIRQNLWGVSKFLMGGASVNDHGIKAVGAGSSNVFCGNTIFQGLGEGILIGDTAPGPYLVGTKIYGNTISNLVSHGIMFWPMEIGTEAYLNTISDCNYNLRYHIMDQAGETNRTVYVYRNKFWLPPGVGGHIYTHFDGQNDATYHPTFWTYHNSFSGGQAGLQVSAYAASNGGIPNCRFVNNIFSDTYYLGQGATIDFMTNSAMVGAFDYNLVTPPWLAYPTSADPAWYGPSNIKSSVVWADQTNMNFALPAGSPAVGNALDVSSNFTLNGSSYSGLDEEAVKRAASWDIGALEFTFAPAPPSGLHIVATGP